MVYNIMSCEGFDPSFMGGCSMAWVGMVVVFFVAALLRKWGGEEAGVDFSFLWSLVAGFGAYIVLITIFGSYKFAVIAGMIGAAAGGYGLGALGFGSED